jgi:alkaline phosphatase
MGYTVVRTRGELLNLDPSVDKVLGLFAAYHTFNDESEEDLRAADLDMYDPDAPTVAEMTRVALDVLDRRGERFLLVVEEEGTDNFGNNNNASGVLEAARRADEAISFARDFVNRHDRNTLLLTTADSDAGGMRMIGIPLLPDVTTPDRLPTRDRNGAPMDGVDGTGTAPFLAAPDQFGRRLPFAVVWAANDDVSGGILVRAEGLNASMVAGSMDNTGIAKLIRRTLLGPDAPQLPR